MIRVLVAEDDPASRAYVKDAVEALGYVCETTRDGQEAVERFREFRPQLLLLDIQMPRKNGLEALYELLQMDPNVVAIMMTAYGNEESAVQAFRIGAHDYLNKPVRTKDLREILKRFESVIETQKQQQLINSFVTARQMSLEIPTQYDVLLPISHFLAQETADALAKPYDMGIRLGYFELLLNAFEHGNLEIGYHKKREYAESPTLRFQDLVQERLQNESLRSRKILVEFTATPLEVVVTISDEGAGFDVATINRELSGPEVFRGSGRGIIICECQFDTVEYLGKGNVVRVTKKLNAPAKKLPDFLKL